MNWSQARKLLSPVIVAGSFLAGERTQSHHGEDTQLVNFEDVIEDTKDKIMQKMAEAHIPGSCCIVHVDGKPVMKAGFGFSDVENCTPFTCNTSMRIASISKLITALITVNLAQEGKVDLNENIVELLKSNEIDLTGGEVDCMSAAQLLSHTAGVRHYHEAGPLGDSTAQEFFSSSNYPTVKDGLQMFINDKLLSEPGSEYNYTTFGYSLLSFVLEKSSGKSFEQLLSDFTSKLGLPHTRLDSFEDIILNRCQYYCKSEKGKLKNCPYVDNSCKWAGGGMVSTAEDIAKLGDILLYLYQSESSDNYVNQETLQSMIELNTVTETERSGLKSHYGYGVRVFHEQQSHGKTAQYFTLSHNGGAVGASSTVLVLPLAEHLSGGSPRGITVVMFSNSLEGDVVRLAREIAATFAERIESGGECCEQLYVV